ALSPAIELESRVGELEARYCALGRLAVAIESTKNATAELRRQGMVVERHTLKAAALADLAGPPVLTPTQPLEDHRSGIIRAVAFAERAQAVQRSLATLSGPPQLVDIDPLEKLINRLTEEQRAVD